MTTPDKPRHVLVMPPSSDVAPGTIDARGTESDLIGSIPARELPWLPSAAAKIGERSVDPEKDARWAEVVAKNTPIKIVMAEHEEVDAFEVEVDEILFALLGSTSALVTDLSQVSDFGSCSDRHQALEALMGRIVEGREHLGALARERHEAKSAQGAGHRPS